MTRARRSRIPYSQAEMLWLETNRTMVISDYHRAFCATFGRPEVSAAHLHGLRKRLGWKVGRAPGRTAGRSRLFSTCELAWLSENRTKPIREYHRDFCSEFSRQDVSAQSLHAMRKRKGWKTGRTGHFAKGIPPANKGKTCPPGVGGRHPNARKTQFKRDQLPHNYRGAGHERIDEDGYVVMIVAETNPWTGADTRPVLKHRYLWEQLNGPLPDDQCLKCLDGDKTNTDPSNWEAIPRGVLPRLNGGCHKKRLAFDAAPASLKPTIMAVAKLEHRIREKKRRQR